MLTRRRLRADINPLRNNPENGMLIQNASRSQIEHWRSARMPSLFL